MAADGYALLYWDTEPRQLQLGLGPFRRRARLLLFCRLATLGAAVVCAAGALGVVWWKLNGVYYPLWLPEAALAVVAAGAFVAGVAWALPDLSIAASVDRRLGLRDRLGTAFHLTRQDWPKTGMDQAMVQDALGHMKRLRPQDAYPLRAGRAVKVMSLCLGALLLAQALPIPPLLLSEQERQEKALLRREAEKIEPVRKKLEQAAKNKDDAEAKKLARKLKKLEKDMRLGRIHKKEALLSLKRMDQELETLEKKAPAAPAKTAQRAAEQLRKAGRERIASRAEKLAMKASEQGDTDAERKLKDLAKQAKKAKDASALQRTAKQVERRAGELGEGRRIPNSLAADFSAALEQGDMETAVDIAAAVADALQTPGEELTQEELDELAEQLEEMADAMEGTDLEELAEAMKKAAEQLRNGETREAGETIGDG